MRDNYISPTDMFIYSKCFFTLNILIFFFKINPKPNFVKIEVYEKYVWFTNIRENTKGNSHSFQGCKNIGTTGPKGAKEGLSYIGRFR